MSEFGKWTKPDAEMPDVGSNVIATTDEGRVVEAWYWGNDGWEISWDPTLKTRHIVAWMPFPEPFCAEMEGGGH
jgi:hypothetical protein